MKEPEELHNEYALPHRQWLVCLRIAYMLGGFEQQYMRQLWDLYLREVKAYAHSLGTAELLVMSMSNYTYVNSRSFKPSTYSHLLCL